MLEIEKKFLLTEEEIERIVEGAEFISEKTFTDSYYDTKNYDLTLRDRWLRKRAGRFELKVPVHENQGRRLFDQYRELESEEDIREELVIPRFKTFAEDLAILGYEPFATFTTTRRKYIKDGIGIDLDIAEFGHRVGETEILVAEESQRDDAIARLEEFARAHRLEIRHVRGKLIEYIFQFRPDHYRLLVNAGVNPKSSFHLLVKNSIT